LYKRFAMTSFSSFGANAQALTFCWPGATGKNVRTVTAMMSLMTRFGKISMLRFWYAMRSARVLPKRFSSRERISAVSASPFSPHAFTGFATGRPHGAPYSMTA
jgi:hypothetical protein